MPSLKSLRIAAQAASHVPPAALVGHLRRRLRDRLVPLRADAFLAGLLREADALPSVAMTATPPAQRAAAVVAGFFAAKHAKNVPQCFDGRFTFLNRSHDFGSVAQVDWRVDNDGGKYQLWRANLAFMGYMCTAIDAAPEQGLAFAARMIESFRREAHFHKRSVFGDLWNSYPVSQRILALSAALIRLPETLAGTPDWYVVDSFLRLNVAYLVRNLETELGFNHLERNLSALTLYALASQSLPERVRAALSANFDHVVHDTIGEDGVQLERSPMYQGLTVQSLRVLRELDYWSPAQQALIARRLTSVELALAAMTLGDDRPSMMNDGWFDETPVTSAILGEHARPGFVALRDAGYIRLAQGDAVILFDAGPIGPDANPGHGHADFLSAEMSLGAERLLVDPGTIGYSVGAERTRTRSWEAHNGPAIRGAQPVTFLGSFKIGQRAAAQLELAEAVGDEQRAAGSLAFGPFAVSRRITLKGGTSLCIIDRWIRGDGERATSFLVPATWRIESHGDRSLTLASASRRVRIEIIGGTLETGEGVWSCRYNQTEPAHLLSVRPDGNEVTTLITWG